MSSESRTGGCLCGKVRYEAQAEIRDVVICHCGQCRRLHGHFAAYAAAQRDDLTLCGDSESHLSWYASSPGVRRGFCRHCGSCLFWDKAGRAIAVAAGTLDTPSRVRVIAHIYTASAGDYYDIPDDDLPRHPKGLPPEA